MRILHLSSTNSLRYCPAGRPSVSLHPFTCVLVFFSCCDLYCLGCLFFFALAPFLSFSCYALAFSHSFFYSITSHGCHIPIFSALFSPLDLIPPSPYLNFLTLTFFSSLPRLMSLFQASSSRLISETVLLCFFIIVGSFCQLHGPLSFLTLPPSNPPFLPHPFSLPPPRSFPGEVSNNGSDGVREGGAIIVLSGVRGIDRPRNMRREKEPLCQIQ